MCSIISRSTRLWQQLSINFSRPKEDNGDQLSEYYSNTQVML